MFRFREWNYKWRIMLYFFLFSLVAAAFCTVGMEMIMGMKPPIENVVWSFSVLIALGLVAGYITAKHIQRGIDELNVSMLEIAKGNFKGRIDEDKSTSFRHIYDTFNVMAETVQDRVSILQKLGEERSQVEQVQIESAVAEERKRLARDLHDTVSQELFAIHMSASSLPKLLASNPQALPGLMEQLIQISHHAQKQMRGLISQLRPIELEDHTLQEALDKWLPDYCNANGLQGEMEVQLDGDMSEAIEHQLFLMIQEAMANVVKHASATHIRLTLREFPHQYILHLEDNGKGFEKSQIKVTSHGLSTMRERAQKLGGEAQIISRVGGGTRVKVQIPKLSEGTTEG